MKAFPNSMHSSALTDEIKGMDLRDYFAAKVMQALLTDPDNVQDVEREGFDHLPWFAYAMADSMMKARKQEGKP